MAMVRTLASWNVMTEILKMMMAARVFEELKMAMCELEAHQLKAILVLKYEVMALTSIQTNAKMAI